MHEGLSPIVVLRILVTLAAILAGTLLLRRRSLTSAIRAAFLVGGVVVLGFAIGLSGPQKMDPSPVFALRGFLSALLQQRTGILPAQGKTLLSMGGILVALLAVSWVSNKSVCGWGCPLGLLQELLHRVKSPKWKSPFWLSNSVRIAGFCALVAGLAIAGFDWIGWVDPFHVFRFSFTVASGVLAALLITSSLFIYRPWCQFLCPFGLISWVIEQRSLLGLRVNREACRGCKICTKVCPTGAMADLYERKPLRADCFACGACIQACPEPEALSWGRRSRNGK